MKAVRIRSDIEAMEGYSFISGTYEVMSNRLGIPREQIIKLDTNENLYGPSPKVLEALTKLDAHIYPEVESTYLRNLLAEYVGVPAAHIFVGAGADQLIDLTMRLFLEPNDVVLDCPPTFTMYALTAHWIGNCRVVAIPRQPDFALDVAAVEVAARASNAKMLFVCSPNNPDGSLLNPSDLERLLLLPLVVVIDEAYIEFSNSQSFATLVPQAPNLIILRTLSKWAGLAGMRIGYGIYPHDIIKHLWKIKPPFNVTVASDAAARATLEDLPTMQAIVQKIIAERERMFLKLSEIPYLEAYPSQGNYIMCRVKDISTVALKQQLDAQGILIRNYSKVGLQDCIRISVGKPEHTEALIAALQKIGVTNG